MGLESIHHLARYAGLAYGDADGAEFRMHAPELRGPTVNRKLEAKGPSYLTQNTRIHLGIRDEQTVVAVFSGYDSPWLYEDYLLRDDLLEHIRNLLEGTKRAEPTKIQVCGHGLGGALATLCALWCAIQWKDANITCVTLGSPKVGDDSFANEFARRGIDCYRLVIESDPFAAMPYVRRYRGTPAWQHVGKEIRLPRYHGDVKSFRNLRQASGISGRFLEFEIGKSVNNAMETIVVYVGVSFGLWIGYWLLKFNQLWLNVSVHSPMAYMTSLQGVIEHDLSTEEDAASGTESTCPPILDADLPVRPPNAPPVPKPDKILKHPSLDAREKELQISIRDVPFVDIDPGVFNRELVKLKLYAKPNPKHLEQPPALGGGNITEGTYSGTQAALIHAYSRIERSYESYFDVMQIEPTLPRYTDLSAKKEIFQYSSYPKNPDGSVAQYPPHLEYIPKEDQVSLLKIFNALGLAETEILIKQVVPDSIVGKTATWIVDLVNGNIRDAANQGSSIKAYETYNKLHRKSGTDIEQGANLGLLPD
ncbi:lipoxygenase [Ilyonectria robusta]